MSRQLKMTTQGDLAVTNGRLSVVEGGESLAQTISTRCKMVRGEYFADLEQGVPFVGTLLTKNPQAELVRSVFRDVILGTPGVTDVIELNYAFDPLTRTATLTGRVEGDAGLTVNLTPVLVTVA